MRLLHTSDWHLGRTFHRVGLLDAQARFLDHLVEVVRGREGRRRGRRRRRLRPGPAAGRRRARCSTTRWSGCSTPGRRWSCPAATTTRPSGSASGRAGLSAPGSTCAPTRADLRRPVLLADEHGAGGGLPPAVPGAGGRRPRPSRSARTHQQRARCGPVAGSGPTCGHAGRHPLGGRGARLRRRRRGQRQRARHQRSAASAAVPQALFDGVDYVALGHLHGRQRLAETVRYCGSPLAYSFSEADQRKGSWLVDLGADGVARVEPVAAPVHRPLAILRGRARGPAGRPRARGGRGGVLPGDPHRRRATGARRWTGCARGSRTPLTLTFEPEGADVRCAAATRRGSPAATTWTSAATSSSTSAAGRPRRPSATCCGPRSSRSDRDEVLALRLHRSRSRRSARSPDRVRSTSTPLAEPGCSCCTGRPAPARPACSTPSASRCTAWCRARGLVAAHHLRSDHAAPGVAPEVGCELTVGGRRFEVPAPPSGTRPKARGTGTTTEQASVRVARAGRRRAGSRRHPARRGRRPAAGPARHGAEQFTKVVLLPQGEFAAFLRAGPDDRRVVLERLFGTDRFSDVETWLAERRTQATRAVREAAAAREQLLARVDERAAALREEAPEQVDGATADGDGARRLYDLAATRLDHARAALQRARTGLEQARTAVRRRRPTTSAPAASWSSSPRPGSGSRPTRPRSSSCGRRWPGTPPPRAVRPHRDRWSTAEAALTDASGRLDDALGGLPDGLRSRDPKVLAARADAVRPRSARWPPCSPPRRTRPTAWPSSRAPRPSTPGRRSSWPRWPRSGSRSAASATTPTPGDRSRRGSPDAPTTHAVRSSGPAPCAPPSSA